MNTHNLDSWEAFEEVVNQSNIETEELKKRKRAIYLTTSIIYRGQPDSGMHLESTLERKVKKNITVNSYFNLILKIWNSADTYKEKWPDLENEIKNLNIENIHLFPSKGANSKEIICFMSHLRHHGFPSPLLDWSANPRKAAFFAFENIPNNAERIAIYTFRYQTGYPSDMSNGLEPTAIEIGPDISGIERHINQEACYTLCVQQNHSDSFRDARFDNMENDIDKPGFYIDSNDDDVDLSSVQNVTNKYTIPVSEKNKVLKKLQTMNINRCFLFEESEDNRLSDYWNIILANEQI